MSDHQNSGREQGMEKYFFRASAADFKKIPGGAVAYWLSDSVLKAFNEGEPLREFSKGSTGLQTSDSAAFVRYVHEPSASTVGEKWFRFAKGGGFRKWFGNVEHLVNWEDDGHEIKNYVAGKYPYLKGNYALVVKNESTYFQAGLLTSRITSGKLSFRVKDAVEIYADACTAIFPSDPDFFLCLLSTKLLGVIQSLNPTLNFQASDIERFPILGAAFEMVDRSIAKSCIAISRTDWDSSENSWGFTCLPLLQPDYRHLTLRATYQELRAHWREMTQEMQRLEEENNRIFIDAYGLQDELTPDVPLNEITLTCNPHYRYGGDKSEEELEALLLADTMRELVSYAVGCMFGRYSLDKPGLILANQGETLADYIRQVPQPSFPADDDNVIPLLDGDWFPDDITLRFRQFLRVAFGDAYYEDNLAFIEQALNVRGKRNYSLRDYFLGEFYADHVKRYKKRPIYWLFSSPKGTFSALVYLHRYRPDTVSVVLNYLRDFRKKLASRLDYLQQVAINPSASQSEKTKASKEADTIKKQLIELDDYERDTLYPLATEQVELDLDDGVKVNYLKLGAALKKIPGLEAKED
ncbi:BREX-1 system adenine-specific DNA-methyltransferase PglX [Pseudomonas guariconensis]|uniref:BREX-1 system adenine-specific DNA-methyltransferase PglX n=1 Tax=Pseudomonas guariconensis TaxID=1288410 RepID=UPI00209BB398|nr:BREX-1 system adenine-specific DNA-methyltransferase PglX [Pseudomonas guariconensis]MCO7623510.1 BREX-1 system adenine-specific DNA-methyltransferase PglX [Pseudomonas guariconensis]